jgi:membrane fusion protein, copper/silver efflux system
MMNRSARIAVPIVILVAALAIGGYYVWQQKKPAKTAEKAGEGQVLYTCAMHPFIIKDKPGTCPICGMQLIKKVQAAAPATASQQQMLEHVSMSPTQAVMANVATTAVARMPLAQEVNATGIVQFDQARQAKVTAWVAGRIDKLYVNTIGAYVSKGRPVAEVYSPELVAAQQEYLLARKSRDQFKNSSIEAISQGGEGLVASARQRLKLMGVKDSQIANLERTGQPNIKLNIYTPLSGVVIEKIVQEGQYVNLGEPLFNIADLSTVWVEAEVYENDFQFVKLGQRVEIVSQSYPGKTFTGRVSYIYPFLDPKTRTVKVRVQLANPGLRLKPDMFVNTSIKAPIGNVLAVPASAVIDTGKRQVVWVETQPNMFAPRDVKVGARVGDNVQILSGLQEGEKVASQGGYLIDSEAQLKGTGGGGHENMPGMKMDQSMPRMNMQQPKGAPPAGGPAPAAPKRGGGMNMDDMKM